MEHVKDYLITISNENIPVIIIASRTETPNSPVILYDGGNHATFYRQPTEVILLDYLAPETKQILLEAPFAVVMETSPDGKDICADYKARIKVVPHNPLTDGLR